MVPGFVGNFRFHAYKYIYLDFLSKKKSGSKKNISYGRRQPGFKGYHRTSKPPFQLEEF